ncbi:MAG: polysaccharide polymerase [Roseovarius sp. BRH_c41]|jgi:exopolysaccharide production protein ExoQ|uniref:O-antigen ligase family protein n=1 Tax=Roseovarius sp. BRH_c41 TaxID=1629709 RepID=UPI0005F1553B|nr:O-antigen ligase family protein [Roseovarius sp. BRH_c41]KJS40544.1 MAG: polysaccharide polymerase [Roseovarius sp. BRH_c41]
MVPVSRRYITAPAHVVEISLDGVLAGIAVAALVLVPMLRTYGALLFLIAGVLLCARHWTRVAAVCLNYWYLLCLPAFCLMSFAWSQFPGLSFRYGLQLMVTMVIALMIVTRISPRLFGRLLFLCFAIAMVASVLVGQVRVDTGAWLGIYGSKNALAGAAAIFVVISIAQALDSSASYRFRLMACFGIMTGGILLLQAQSMSALLLIPPALLIQAGLLILYRLTPLQRSVTIIAVLLGVSLGVLLVAVNMDALVRTALEMMGKDATLTGRTDLWRMATDLIAQRPLFGVGYQAFWVQGHAPAEALWAQFGIDGRSGFNFHNTYLSNAVEIGLVGVALQVGVLYGAAVVTYLWALRSRSAEATLMFVMVVIVIMISFVEVPVFFQFSLRTVLIICAFAYAVQELRATR